MKIRLLVILLLGSLSGYSQSNVGWFYGSTDGSESIDLKLGNRGSGDVSFQFRTSYVNGQAYMFPRSGAWGNWTTWQRGSSIGIKNILKFGGSDALGHYFTLYDKNDGATSNILLHANGKSYFNGGNFGIGTTDPSHLLSLKNGSFELYGSGENSGTFNANHYGAIHLYADGNGSKFEGARIEGLRRGAANDQSMSMSFFVNLGSDLQEVMRLNNNGNVGIGTTDPHNRQHIVASSDNDGLLIERDHSDDHTYSGILFKNVYNDEDLYKKGALYFEKTSGSGRGKFHFALEGTNDNSNVDITDAVMSINYDGNVGIGTTDPTSLLTLGNTTATMLSTSGISLGKYQNSIELLHSEFENGFGSKIYGTVDGGGITSMRFAVRGNATTWTDAMYIQAGSTGTGNVGIGTNSPKELLHVNGNYYGLGHIFLHAYEGDGSSGTAYLQARDKSGTSSINMQFRTQNNGSFSNVMRLTSDGKVGIGTTNPTQMLEVAGTIRSREVKVEVAAGTGPDYVFEPDYDLRTLAETKEYIEENKHLPEIPSAREMEANGIDIGEINMLLLKKIEEMTLHQIELMEKLEAQQKRIADLEKKVK